MTDTPTPERGDGTTERDEMLADGLRLAAKLPGSIMSVMGDEIVRLRAALAPQGVTAAAIKQHVTQTRLHSESVNGNCMAACFASVLGGDIAEYDAILDPLIPNGAWWDAVERIFIKHGFGVIRISAHYNKLGGAPGGVCFANGVSPRGVRHMCVMKDGKIAHDPHPSRAGLDVIDDYTIIVPWALPQMPTFSTTHPGAPRDGE